MELRVHVDNTIRTVCGLERNTTVQEIILALAHSLKQTGRFYMIENHHSKKLNLLPRIMSPSEKPLDLLDKYSRLLDLDTNVQFYLVRCASDESESNDLSKLLRNINVQQVVLEEQSKKLKNLLQDIEKYEITNLNLNANEIFKRKLLILDLKHKLNKKKLDKLENQEENSDLVLNKEIELNQFLLAQQGYYRRKLNMSKYNLESIENEYEKLKSEYNSLIDCLPEQSEVESEASLEEESMLVDCKESVKQFEINKAKLNYLEFGTSNLEKNIDMKKSIIQKLENEYKNLLTCETNINNIPEQDEASLISSSSSSECLSPVLQETKQNINKEKSYSKNPKTPVRSYGNSRYSRIRRLNRIESNNNNNIRSPRICFNYEDIHYF